MLFGVAEVEFDLKSQTVPVDDFLPGQIQVAGEQVTLAKTQVVVLVLVRMTTLSDWVKSLCSISV